MNLDEAQHDALLVEDSELGSIEFACQPLTGAARWSRQGKSRLSYYMVLWGSAAVVSIYAAGACMWLFGFWPLQPQFRPIGWAVFAGSFVSVLWTARRMAAADRLVIHVKGFRYRLGLFYRGQIRYDSIGELEIGRGLDFDRLGVMEFIMKRKVVELGRRTSIQSAIIKTNGGKLRVMMGVLLRFSDQDLANWLHAVSSRCPDRIRVRAD